MTKKTEFAVFARNDEAAFVMAYICTCGKPGIGYSDDMKGLYTGVCGNGHPATVTAS